ncbi:MAG: DUF502 domain-containing protein [Halobacteria archaeon]|nr:DUF502 domain-containing protein [Halobacteria archaeon]
MSLSKDVRNSFIAGLALIAPLAITLIVLQIIFNWITGFIQPFIEITALSNYTANIEIVAQILGAFILIVFITFLGFTATKGIGNRLFTEFEELINRIPFVSSIYSSVRQVSNALIEGDSRFDSVVLLEWPRDGMYTMGFVTNTSPNSAREKVSSESEVYNVFIPMSPNPTAGFLMMVPEDRVESIDISVESALRMILTTGITSEDTKIPTEPEPRDIFPDESPQKS